jgi:hypothetical protein
LSQYYSQSETASTASDGAKTPWQETSPSSMAIPTPTGHASAAPGFAIARERTRPWPGLLNGKSARIIVTMGMPAWLYRWYFLAHSLKSLERNILRFSGVKPVRETLIGGVEAGGMPSRARWLETVRARGYAGK